MPMRKVGQISYGLPKMRIFATAQTSHSSWKFWGSKNGSGNFHSCLAQQTHSILKLNLPGANSSIIPSQSFTVLPTKLWLLHSSYSPLHPNLCLSVSPDGLCSTQLVLLTGFCQSLPAEPVSVWIVVSGVCENREMLTNVGHIFKFF